MLNMIKLDWLGMKYYQKRIFIMPLFIFLYGFLSEAFIVLFMSYLTLVFSVNPFAVEEKGKLDNLYLTLPVTRKTIVRARFGLSLIMQFAGLIVGIIVTIIYARLLYGREVIYTHTFKANFDTMFLTVCTSLLFYAVMNLSIFPILFKLGYAKGKAVGFFMPVAGICAAIIFIFTLWQFKGAFRAFILSAHKWALANAVITAVLMLAAAALILAFSYTLSYKVYAKREF